jgi:Leucine Rich Repeat (LRR) protein
MAHELTRGRSLESLRKEAKRWLKAIHDNDSAARARFERAIGSIPDHPGLRDVQHALALEMGFAGWSALKRAAEEAPTPASPSAAGYAALARYEDMADALLEAYRTGTPEAMSRHYAYTWHRRAWLAMRTYVQLDLGKRPAIDGTDAEITVDDARKLVALEYGFADWDALRSFALGLGDATTIAAKPVAVTTGDGTSPRIVAATRDWSAAIAVMSERKAAGLDARGQMTDAVLEQLSRVEGIQELRLGNSKGVTDNGLRHLRSLQQLRHLDLSMTAVTDRGLEVLRAFPLLESVNLSWTRVTDAGVAHLAACDSLRRVHLGGTVAGDGALRTLAGKSDLAVLETGAGVTNDGLRLLREFPVFRTWRDGEAEIGLLRGEAQPNRLALSGAISDEGMAALQGLDGLFALDISDQSLHVSPPGLAFLATLEHLSWLSIDATDETMPAIARLPHLRHLACQDTQAGDNGFAALSASRSIESIWGRRCHNLRTAGFLALATMPALRALSVSCLNVEDEGIAALPTFPALRELMPMDVPDDGYRHIGQCAELDSLVLMYCRETGDRATERIAGLPKLRKYFASYTKITDRTPEILSQMDSLEQVEISGCPGVTDVGVARLARLPRLREISISGQSLTPGVVEAFPPGVKVKWER